MPAVVFLIAALVCSLVGRILLVRAAFGVSVGWGLTVLFVPFGPLFFRMNYRELTESTRIWRLATAPLLLLFFVNGGSSTSVTSLFHSNKSGTTEEASAGDTHFHLPVPSKVIASITHSDAAAETKASTPSPAPTAAPHSAATPIAVAPSPTPSATPSKAVAASAAAMAPALKVLSPAERVAANRKEFERLAEWYENLKRERGYLRKGDNAAVEAYNAEAAKYQTALQLAKTEQAELAKLTATAKK